MPYLERQSSNLQFHIIIRFLEALSSLICYHEAIVKSLVLDCTRRQKVSSQYFIPQLNHLFDLSIGIGPKLSSAEEIIFDTKIYCYFLGGSPPLLSMTMLGIHSSSRQPPQNLATFFASHAHSLDLQL